MTDCGCNNFPASLGNVTFGAGVGIGTQPGAPIEVFSSAPSADTTGGGIILSRYNVGGSYRGGAIYSRFISETNTDDLVFAVSGDTNPYTDFTQARMVLTQEGHLGLGTTTPLGGLDNALNDYCYFRGNVNGASPSVSFVGGGFALGWNQSDGGGEVDLVANAAGGTTGGFRLQSWDGSTLSTQLTVQGGGNVGIGTTTPATPLHVLGNPGELARFQGGTGAQNERNYITLYSTNPSYWWEISNQDQNGGGLLSGLAFSEVSGGVPQGPFLYLAQSGQVRVNTTNNNFTGPALLVAGQIAWLDSMGNATGHVDPEARSLVLYGTTVADDGGCYYAP